MAIDVRLGVPADVDEALAVYERSNLARRHGRWPSRAARVEHVGANMGAASSWFVVATDGGTIVAMALVLPFRTDRGAGPVVPGTAFLDLIYVLPDRWGRGIGGAILDAVVEEAARRGCPRVHLWTHERDNERAQRLYASRGFLRTGVTGHDEDGDSTAEWMRDGA